MGGALLDPFERYADRAEARLADRGLRLSERATADLRHRVEDGVLAARAQGLADAALTESLDLVVDRFADAFPGGEPGVIDANRFAKTWNAVCSDPWCRRRWSLSRRR